MFDASPKSASNVRVWALTARTFVFTLWAGVLAVVGLRLVLPSSDDSILYRPVMLAGGVMALGGGHFVFMTMVADRLLPRARRGFIAVAELVSFLAFLIGLVLLLWQIQTGNSN